MAQITIRKLDDDVLNRFSMLAKKSKISREEYIRNLLTEYSYAEITRNVENKYENIIYTLADIIQNNSDELNEVKLRLEQLLDNERG